MNVLYSDSKTDLKVWCDYCIKFELFEGGQDVTRLTAVCCILLPHNPCRLPHHYKRNICGPSCSCKHWFLWISPIFEHQFCPNYMVTLCHWQPFLSTSVVRFAGQCWYSNPMWTPLPTVPFWSRSCFAGRCWYSNPKWTPVPTINKAISV